MKTLIHGLFTACLIFGFIETFADDTAVSIKELGDGFTAKPKPELGSGYFEGGKLVYRSPFSKWTPDVPFEKTRVTWAFKDPLRVGRHGTNDLTPLFRYLETMPESESKPRPLPLWRGILGKVRTTVPGSGILVEVDFGDYKGRTVLLKWYPTEVADGDGIYVFAESAGIESCAFGSFHAFDYGEVASKEAQERRSELFQMEREIWFQATNKVVLPKTFDKKNSAGRN
jgi:hypothetical protein